MLMPSAAAVVSDCEPSSAIRVTNCSIPAALSETPIRVPRMVNFDANPSTADVAWPMPSRRSSSVAPIDTLTSANGASAHAGNAPARVLDDFPEFLGRQILWLFGRVGELDAERGGASHDQHTQRRVFVGILDEAADVMQGHVANLVER